MISKHIPRTTKSSFRRLAKYIAGAEDEGEKLSDFWIVNSNAGETIDDLDLAIIDIENTQSQNTRCRVDKTYHLLVSFKDEKPDLISVIGMCVVGLSLIILNVFGKRKEG